MFTIDKAELYAIQYQRELFFFSAWLRGDVHLLDVAQDDQDREKKTSLDERTRTNVKENF